MNDGIGINPCQDCSPQAECVDNQYCKCKRGFTGNGRNCSGKSRSFNQI